MTKLCLATFSSGRGTCLNTRHMIWISVIHEINRPDELFGTLSYTTVGLWVQQKKGNLDLVLNHLKEEKWGQSYLIILSDANLPNLRTYEILSRKNQNVSNHSHSLGNLKSHKCLPCDNNNISVMLPREICPSTMALSIWAMRQYSEKHSPLIWEHNSE